MAQGSRESSECQRRPFDISPFAFCFWGFLEERICADTPKSIKELTDTRIGGLCHPLLQMSGEAIAVSKSVCLPGVNWGTRKRDQTGAATLNAADRQLGLGVASGMLGLFCNFLVFVSARII